MRQIGKALLLPLLAGLAACSHATIANTPIPDTGENRQVLDVLARYKVAVEAKDLDAVLQLVSTDYMDVTVPGRAVDPHDFAGLKNALLKEFQNTRTLKLEVHPRNVRVQGDEANVDYFYVVRFDPIMPNAPNGDSKWHSEPDDGRLKLRKQNGQWKIVSGL